MFWQVAKLQAELVEIANVLELAFEAAEQLAGELIAVAQ